MAWISFLIKDVAAVVARNQPVMTATAAMVFHSAKKTKSSLFRIKRSSKEDLTACQGCGWKSL